MRLELAWHLIFSISELNLECYTLLWDCSVIHDYFMSSASVIVVLMFSTVSHNHDLTCHVFHFSQPSTGLHYRWGLFGIRLTFCRLCQLWCLWLPLRDCLSDLHEDHILCGYSCCCKCLYEFVFYCMHIFKFALRRNYFKASQLWQVLCCLTFLYLR